MKLNPKQKIEISHDILAREVYARIDADEKMRLKITQFLHDRYDYYVEAGVLLDKKDLEYIAPYEDKVPLRHEQADFIKESRQEVEARERKRRRRNLIIGSVLAAAAIVSIFFTFRATQQTIVAQKATEEAKTALQKVEEAQSRVRRVVESVES